MRGKTISHIPSEEEEIGILEKSFTSQINAHCILQNFRTPSNLINVSAPLQCANQCTQTHICSFLCTENRLTTWFSLL